MLITLVIASYMTLRAVGVIGVPAPAQVKPVPAGHHEIALLAPATSSDTWERLAASEVWGSGIGDTQTGAPFLGVEFGLEARECIIAKVLPGTAADKGGLKAGDMVVRFDDRAVESSEDLARLVSRKHPGDRVAVEVRRDDEIVRLRVTIGKKAD